MACHYVHEYPRSLTLKLVEKINQRIKQKTLLLYQNQQLSHVQINTYYTICENVSFTIRIQLKELNQCLPICISIYRKLLNYIRDLKESEIYSGQKYIIGRLDNVIILPL